MPSTVSAGRSSAGGLAAAAAGGSSPAASAVGRRSAAGSAAVGLSSLSSACRSPVILVSSVAIDVCRALRSRIANSKRCLARSHFVASSAGRRCVRPAPWSALALLGLELTVELLEFGVGLLIFLFQAGQFGLQFGQMLLVGVERPLQTERSAGRRTAWARWRHPPGGWPERRRAFPTLRPPQ